MSCVAEPLAELIRRSGQSQGEVGRALGRTQTAVSYWISGKRTPKAEDIVALAAHFGVTTDEVLGVTPLAAEGHVLALNLRPTHRAYLDLMAAVYMVAEVGMTEFRARQAFDDAATTAEFAPPRIEQYRPTPEEAADAR